jgi:pyruvate dehydrogenase E2 component (dihydrolipoamide acetyltransferase)
MPIPVTVPRLGWNMDEGTFVEWVKADGDPVRPGDVMFRLEGEKATEEVTSLDTGTLHIPAEGPRPGDKVKVGAVIGYLLQAGEPAPLGRAGGMSPPRQQDELRLGVSEFSEQVAGEVDVQRGAGAPRSPAVTPRARRLARQTGIDPTTLRGTGRNGRVCERDVMPLAKPQAAQEVVPHTPLRRAIAGRMMESRRTTAPVTLTSAVDATNLVNLRAQFKAVAGGAVPSYTDVIVKLAAVALQQHPIMTARWTDAGLAYPDRINIGVAVDTDAGLLVLVLRDVPAMGLTALAARSRELVDRARRGECTAAELRDGCFTITNLGAFGIDAFTPILNPPECAVLGVGRIARKPVVDGDRVVVRDVVTLSLTFDHRIVDGAPAARFLQTLAACVENPAPWLTS